MRHILYRIFLLTMLGCALMSCSTTKHVPQGDYLLTKGKLKVAGEGLRKADIEPLIRQRPNKTIFWKIPLYLMFYNMASEKDRFISRLMRNAGEPPVILDSALAVNTAQRMEQYASYRGYYGSKAEATIAYGKRKAGVSYSVKLAQPYRIRSISYAIMDEYIDTSLIIDPAQRLINVGDIFDGEALRKESSRISGNMRTYGYYNFYDSYVTYRADTTLGSREVDLTMLVAKEQLSPENPTGNHRRFYVQDLSVTLEDSPKRAQPAVASSAVAEWDTIRSESFEMLCRDCAGEGRRPGLRPGVIAMNNAVKPGSLYNVQEVDLTYRNLANLRVFRSLDVRFSELPVSSPLADTSPRPLRGVVTLSPSMRQSYEYGGEVSLSDNGLFGASITGHHQHKNLFRGAEILDVSLVGIFQKVQLYADATPENSYELGTSISLNTPRILFPFRFGFYRNVYSPRTQIALLGNFQQRPDYARALADVTFGYSWRNLGSMIYIFTMDMNLIKILKIAPSFENSISSNPYLLNSYQNAFLLGSSTSAIYSSRNAGSRLQQHLRFDIELKGNLLWLGYKVFGATPKENNKVRRIAYEVAGTQFAQFTKLDATYTGLRMFSAASSIAFRALAGVGIAYGNSFSLPFDKMYYSGGANSMRGWQMRTLGPGSYRESGNLLNHLADMRMEMNVEYRFKLLWKMEGAIFADAGNIWAIREEDSRKDARFSLREFPRQVAINWGMGLRLNFSLLVVRVDYGIRLHDPALTSAYFVTPDRWFSSGTNQLFLAIGYPF